MRRNETTLTERQAVTLKEALTYFPADEVADLEVRRSFNHPTACFVQSYNLLYDEETYLLFSDEMHDMMNERDILFVYIHELRHAVQHRRGWLKSNGIGGIIWHGINYGLPIYPGQAGYCAQPWEADANGYAHYAMGGYIPTEPRLRRTIDFCTRPAEFAPATEDA